MSAHAAAAGAGCCCNPPAKPCTCLEYGMASDGVDFDRLAVGGTLAMNIQGKDCCGAQLTGNAVFGGTRLFKVPSQVTWLDRRDTACPGLFFPLGEVIGSATSTVGHCTYIYECCNYTGCPTVPRLVTYSQLPWFYCPDTVTVQTVNVCANVICQCDEGGVPCGGNCPVFAFEDYTTASAEVIYFAIRSELGIWCGPGLSYFRLEIVPISARAYDSCDGCGTGLTNVPGGGAFTGFWTKPCRFPGDTVRGVYEWNSFLSGPPTQVDTVDQPCTGGYLPGGALSVTRSIIASPLLTVS